jgi:hypothetical protein
VIATYTVNAATGFRDSNVSRGVNSCYVATAMNAKGTAERAFEQIAHEDKVERLTRAVARPRAWEP